MNKLNTKKILILILVFIITINLVIDNPIYATSMSLSSIYGKEDAAQIISFILASAAVGISYKTLEDVEESIVMIDWNAILNSAPEPPHGGGQKPNVKLILSLLLGVPSGAFLSSIFGDISDWFRSKGAQEGENLYNEDLIYYYNQNQVYNIHSNQDVKINIKDDYYLTIDTTIVDSDTTLIELLKGTSGRIGLNLKNHQYPFVLTLVSYSETSTQLNLTFDYQYYSYSGDGKLGSKNRVSNKLIPKLEDFTPKNPISYNVQPNSTLVTGNSPVHLPQLDLDMLPNLQRQVNPQGEEELIYPGTIQELTDDFINNATWEDIQKMIQDYNSGEKKPYTLTETQTGTKIDYGDYVSPYPDIEVEPIEDVSQFQGENIGLLKSIVNWLSLLRNDILSIPKTLFQVPTDLSIDFSKLRLADFQNKFPFSIPWDLYNAIKLFAKSPTTPNLVIDLDTDYFSLYHQIDLSKISLPLMFARYTSVVFFIIFLISKTRDLIKW